MLCTFFMRVMAIAGLLVPDGEISGERKRSSGGYGEYLEERPSRVAPLRAFGKPLRGYHPVSEWICALRKEEDHSAKRIVQENPAMVSV
jgi:hypothetical protein